MIKEINKILNDLANNHPMINSYEVGDNFDMQKTGESIYPMLFFEDNTFNINYLKGYKTFNLTYYIVEQPMESGEDYIELMNKIEIINDNILQYLQLDNVDLVYEFSNINSIPLKEWMGDKTCAIRTEITFNVLREINNCLIL